MLCNEGEIQDSVSLPVAATYLCAFYVLRFNPLDLVAKHIIVVVKIGVTRWDVRRSFVERLAQSGGTDTALPPGD